MVSNGSLNFSLNFVRLHEVKILCMPCDTYFSGSYEEGAQLAEIRPGGSESPVALTRVITVYEKLEGLAINIPCACHWLAAIFVDHAMKVWTTKRP